VPGDIPEAEAQTPLPRVLRFRFRRFSMKRWGKPKDVHGMELVWLISDTPPKEVEELIHSAVAARSPLELTFKESERGKRLYYAVRRETGTVKKGKFSEIFSALSLDSLRRVHTQEPAHAGEPWGGTKGMDPESDTL
jgi:hypothetical protein